MNRIVFFLLSLLSSLTMAATGIDDIQRALRQSALSQVQEKVYVHTDNSCYFVGDTLWYKAYVVRADDLLPTDMSRILYVELLSPDGLLVERQQIIVSGKGYTCGQFALRDSLYSGYYELRAYTRWMLNFNVGHQRYSRQDTWLFYNKQMAADYFRTWEGLYSRVLPVYGKPESAGDYDARRMYQRPKTRIPKQKKDDLLVTFYPEGGHLVKGIQNRVAFDITDQHGEAVNIKGTLTADGQQLGTIQTEHMGRGTITVTPDNKTIKAHFTFRGKDYSIPLPKAEPQGIALLLDNNMVTLTTQGLPTDKEYAVSILCRGSLKHFSPLSPLTSHFSIPVDSLPTGVNELTVFDSDGRIWASRLFFVNHHDHDQALITTTQATNRTYAPYEQISIPVSCSGVNAPTVFSIAITDTNTDEPTYNDGNIMTDLLLSSDLRGFIAHPAHYFESDDAEHRRHLDLLMMVQGWRKYKWQELSDTTFTPRYQPEQTMTVEGSVYKMLSIDEVQPDEVADWQNGTMAISRESQLVEGEDGLQTLEETVEYGSLDRANDNLGINHGRLRHEVLVEAELYTGDSYVGSTQTTRNGQFIFEIPPFYGTSYLNLKAYSHADSLKKNMESRKDPKVFDEDAYPDYYVKRDLFFPVHTRDYNFYEKHIPDYTAELLIDTLSELSMENDVHQLRGVDVKGHRRGRRAVDWNKPAYVLDAYDLYNQMTDYGLSFGKVDMRQFPIQVCRYLYGNMHRYKTYHVDGRIDGFTYYRNYSPVSKSADEAEAAGVFRANRTSQSIYKNLKMSRLQDIRLFSDFEPRSPDSTTVEEVYSADATVELITIPDEGRQVVYRDRHFVLNGFAYPEQFYQPDYSNRDPGSMPADYRRTLYWNPNAVTDSEGHFTATFYNNSKETRIRMTAAGISGDGRLLHSK